jgi:hypothetical protein
VRHSDVVGGVQGRKVDIANLGRPIAARYDPLTPTVFHETWWLDAASGGDYDEVLVRAGGRVVGRLPFSIIKMPARCGLCTMPNLTHFLGPAIDAGEGAAANRALKYDGILRELVSRLPPHTGFYQKLHRETADTLVFQDHGYRTTVQFTYELAPAAPADIWAAMRDKTRNVIRRAEEKYTVGSLHDPAEFAAIYDRNLKSRGMSNYYRRIVQICDAALQRDAGRIIVARDQSGQIAAAIFYVWDARTAYYLLSTRSDNAANCAVSLLIWQAIQDTLTRGLLFDFDGVATPGSRLFYTGFGGQVSPRYIVSRYRAVHLITSRLMRPFTMAPKETYL